MEQRGDAASGRAPRVEPRNEDYDALFAMTSTPTLEVTADGTVVAANRAAGRLVHRDPGRIVGLGLTDLLGDDAAATLGSAAPVDVVAELADGATALRLFSVPRHLSSGPDAHRVVQVIRREGRAARDADRRAQSGRMSLIDDISHNLGTPLAIVAGYAETLADRWAELGAPEVERATDAIRKHAQRAVEELRDVQARVRAVDGGTGTVPTNMLVAWLRRMLAAPLSATGSAIVDGDVPTQVTVDASVTRQAMLSICQALLGADVPADEIRISATTSAEGTVFTIEGHGLGGPRDDHREILAVTEQVVRDAGGAYSHDEQCAVHTLRLPSYTIGGRTPSRIAIAVIEDDPDAAALIRASLRSLSSVFEIVADERTLGKGIDAVARTQPRMLLLDNVLPDGQGSEAIERIRRVSPRTTIVMFSARRPCDEQAAMPGVHWLEKGRVMADLGTELLAVLAAG